MAMNLVVVGHRSARRGAREELGQRPEAGELAERILPRRLAQARDNGAIPVDWPAARGKPRLQDQPRLAAGLVGPLAVGWERPEGMLEGARSKLLGLWVEVEREEGVIRQRPEEPA